MTDRELRFILSDEYGSKPIDPVGDAVALASEVLRLRRGIRRMARLYAEQEAISVALDFERLLYPKKGRKR